MHINDVKKFIGEIILKQVPVTVAMMGPSGIGKSAIEKQLSKEHNIGFIDLRCATQEAGDLIGIPYKVCSSECIVAKSGEAIHKGEHKTQYATPFWFPEEGTRGVLCIEELNRAAQDVRQCMFQLIWDRELHGKKLPVGWSIVLALNPDNGEYQVETLDKALTRRTVALMVEPNVDVWLDWALKEGDVPKDIVGFVGTHKNMLFEPETFDFPVKRTPAGWGDTLSVLKRFNAIPADLEFEIIAGIVGKEAATAFRKYQDEHYLKPVSGEAVLKNYEEVRERVLAQRKKTDEMYVTIKEITSICENDKKLPKKQKENLILFTLDLPLDMATMFMQRLPADLVTELGEDRRVTNLIGETMKASREEKSGKK